MVKKICIVTTSEENFFTPPFLKYCTRFKKIDIEIVFIPGFLNLKKLFYFILLLNFKEIIEIIYFKLFNKSIVYKCKTHHFKSINKNDFHNFIKKKNFDLIVSYNCNQIFTSKTLKKINCDIVNFHPGLLPKYKGLFPNFYSLMNKENHIGITFHVVEKKIDGGKIIKRFKIKVEKCDTVFRLYKKIFLNHKSHKFIYNCILNYKKLIKYKFKSRDLYKYNSYPRLEDIIKFKFK
ncbi:hypothetical protein IDH13_03245 [Pelagibacterales bacterium SAG-MED34]|nr:hypothetical protein [Pelagibacterales bacterium SAG-MED34]